MAYLSAAGYDVVILDIMMPGADGFKVLEKIRREASCLSVKDLAVNGHDLINLGYISGAYLGVYVSDMDSSLSAYGIPIGVYVEEVIEGNCARKAGVQAKDIILKLGEYEIDSLSALSRAMDKFEPGDTTTITVWRSGVQLELEITLDEKPH